MATFAPKQQPRVSSVSTGSALTSLIKAKALTADLTALAHERTATIRVTRLGPEDGDRSSQRGSLATRAIQTKLSVTKRGDGYEREADRVAERVMQIPALSAQLPQTSTRTGSQSTCSGGEGCDTGDGASSAEHISMLSKQTRDGGAGPAEAPPSVHRVLDSPGKPLDVATRAFMESRFGWDFSRVRIHADAAAERSARDINARAYTVGQNVVFGAGQYAPEGIEGKRLIAHELAHVVQQRGPSDSRQVETGNGAPMLQRQPAQTSDLPASPSDTTDPGYDETAKAASYRVRVIAHASPRWRGAVDDKQADRLNLELSKKRADEVAFEVRKLLAEHLPAGSSVSVEASAALAEGTVGISEEAHGSRDTLPEAGGNRKDNAEQRRRVDVIVARSQSIAGSAGASRPLLRRPTASKFWHVSVDLVAGGSAGAAGYLLAITLTNDSTGDMMHGRVWSGGGGPKASIGASYSLGDSTGFMTSEPMDFEDFEGQMVAYTSGGVSAFIGYSWSYLTFFSIRTAPKDINVSGASVGTVGIGGSVTSGTFHYEGTPAYPKTSVPVEHTGETSVSYSRTASGEYKFAIYFSTEGSALSDIETAFLDSNLASIVASTRP